MLREVIIKIGLKQKEDKEEIIIEILLDSGATGLVMSEVSRLQEMDLVFSYFLILIFNLFSIYFIFLFLELRIRVSNDITWSHISHNR